MWGGTYVSPMLPTNGIQRVPDHQGCEGMQILGSRMKGVVYFDVTRTARVWLCSTVLSP